MNEFELKKGYVNSRLNYLNWKLSFNMLLYPIKKSWLNGMGMNNQNKFQMWLKKRVKERLQIN